MANDRVYLVRHARAAEAGPDGDAARSLTPEGRESFRALATALAPELGLARIHASPFRRAAETAALLAGAGGVSAVPDPALAPGASAGRALLALAARLGAGTALVGHNPEMAEAVAVAAGRQTELRPGSIAAVDVAADGWTLAWVRHAE